MAVHQKLAVRIDWLRSLLTQTLLHTKLDCRTQWELWHLKMTFHTASPHGTPWHSGTNSIWHSSQTNPTLPDPPRWERGDVCGCVWICMLSPEVFSSGTWAAESKISIPNEPLQKHGIHKCWQTEVLGLAIDPFQLRPATHHFKKQQQHSHYGPRPVSLRFLLPSLKMQFNFRLQLKSIWSHPVTIFCFIIFLSLTVTAGYTTK